MSREKDIILALNENRRLYEDFDSAIKGASITPRFNEDGFMNYYEDVYDDEIVDDEIVYSCPECGEEFVSDEVITGSVECPECGAYIVPEYEGEYDELYGDDDELLDYDENPYDEYSDDEYYDDDDDDVYDDDDEYYGEGIVKRVQHGRVVKKKVKAGYKNVDGKLVKMSSAEKRARQKSIKKARKKSHTGAANKMRRRSMKKAAKLNNGLDLNFNENAFLELINGVVDDVMENYRNYENFEVVSIDEAVMNPSDLDTLDVEATVRYENGRYDTANFTIEGLTSDDGEVLITENNGILDPDGLTITGTLRESYNTVNLATVGYELNNRSFRLSETFEYYRR